MILCVTTNADPETTRFILNYTKGALQQQMADVDAMDAKAINVFAVASTVVGLAAFAFADAGGRTVSGLLVAAVLTYGVVAISVFASMQGHEYTAGHYASSLWRKFWQSDVETIEYALVSVIPDHFEQNLSHIRGKARTLGWAMRALGLETVLIGAALLASRL